MHHPVTKIPLSDYGAIKAYIKQQLAKNPNWKWYKVYYNNRLIVDNSDKF